MAQTPEGRVKAAVKKVLDEYGVWYYMPVQNGMGVTGIPDFVCCWNGWFIGIETKAPGKTNTLTPGQDRVGKEIMAHDGHWMVADDADYVRRYLEAIKLIRKLEGTDA